MLDLHLSAANSMANSALHTGWPEDFFVKKGVASKGGQLRK
jgi:hypothetical protein